MIKRFDRAVVKRIGTQAQQVLATALAEEGITVEYSGGRYSEDSLTLKLKLSVDLSEDEKDERARQEFSTNAFLLGVGFTVDDYGRMVKVRGKAYRLVALRPKAGKYPVVLETDSGTQYIFGVAEVLTALGKKVPPMFIR